MDESLSVGCAPTVAGEVEGPDNTIYLDVTGWSWDLSGFYVQTGDQRPLFSHISLLGGHKSFLYKIEDTWIISELPYDSNGLAFLHDDCDLPTSITNTEWYFAHNYEWVPFTSHIIKGGTEINIYASLLEHRRIKYLPDKQGFFELRNNIIMPSLGLGTGGIRPDVTEQIIRDGLRLGYRLVDLAREYRNEEIVGRLLQERTEDDRIPLRQEVFLTSKVWPTHLGFAETTKEIVNSMRSLETAYIDMYMIHWPM